MRGYDSCDASQDDIGVCEQIYCGLE
jgi:hypothetical protein